MKKPVLNPSSGVAALSITLPITHQSVIKTTFLLYKAVVSAMAGV
jgi:hypothetical protein